MYRVYSFVPLMQQIGPGSRAMIYSTYHTFCDPNVQSKVQSTKSWAVRPDSQSLLQFIKKVLDGLEFRAQCRPLKTQGKPFLFSWYIDYLFVCVVSLFVFCFSIWDILFFMTSLCFHFLFCSNFPFFFCFLQLSPPLSSLSATFSFFLSFTDSYYQLMFAVFCVKVFRFGSIFYYHKDY